VIKRAVLEHQHDDMLDLPQVGDTALVSHNGYQDANLAATPAPRQSHRSDARVISKHVTA
jgi:hypothetical protein